jgi:hypothetical protein
MKLRPRPSRARAQGEGIGRFQDGEFGRERILFYVYIYTSARLLPAEAHNVRLGYLAPHSPCDSAHGSRSASGSSHLRV